MTSAPKWLGLRINEILPLVPPRFNRLVHICTYVLIALLAVINLSKKLF